MSNPDTPPDEEAATQAAMQDGVSAVSHGTVQQIGSPAEWVSAKPVDARRIDLLSVSSLYLKLWSETEMELGTATGFVVHYKRRLFLVTNWHVLSGRHTVTNEACHSSLALPHQVRIAHQNGPKLGFWAFAGEPLYNDAGEPRWIEHPRGRDVDVAALELTTIPPATPMHPFDLQLQYEDLPTPPGTSVCVIGFPLGLRENQFFAIWKTGHIASDVELRDDYFLIDATTREGMSGSPVVARRWINEPTEVFPGRPGALLGQPGRIEMVEVETKLVTKFLGIYSGRIHEHSEIGRVWRPKVIREVLERATS